MQKPHFIFTKKINSFSVHVENLEKLHVKQIQVIQDFVSARNGYFDFNTYTFTIKKNLEFQEFVKLLKTLHVDSVIEEKTLHLKNNARIEFGQYKGMFYNELPDSYLLWLKNNYIGKDREILCNEITSRNL